MNFLLNLRVRTLSIYMNKKASQKQPWMPTLQTTAALFQTYYPIDAVPSTISCTQHDPHILSSLLYMVPSQLAASRLSGSQNSLVAVWTSSYANSICRAKRQWLATKMAYAFATHKMPGSASARPWMIHNY